MSNILQFIFETLLAELLLTIFAVLIANRIQAWWQSRRFGGWKVQFNYEDHQLPEQNISVNREVSPTKIQQVLGDEADLSVYVKGIASPYGTVLIDLVNKRIVDSEGLTKYTAILRGKTIKSYVLRVDKINREIKLKLDNTTFNLHRQHKIQSSISAS